MTQDPDHLDLRAGLPDALRVLLGDFPRAGWEENPHFEGMVRFWLDRHMMFRKLTGLLASDAEAFLDGKFGTEDWAPRLGNYGSMLVNELHGHHHIEDAHYFPMLARAEPRLASGFELLDRDHQALDIHLGTFAERANAVLRGVGEADLRDPAGAFREEMRRFERFLDRHLVDEEELVVPVLLKHAPAGLV